MGQNQSFSDNVIPDTVDTLQMQVVKHAKVFSEIGLLTYEDFKQCLEDLNALSRKCLDPSGKRLLFLIKNGTDSSLLWKATVKIACVKVDPDTRKIDQYKLLNLKQFLCVFNTFQSHLQSLGCSEKQRERRGSGSSDSSSDAPITASILMDRVHTMMNTGQISPTSSICSDVDQFDECSICLDRKTEVILPCAHSFCAPCIEQWNVNNKTCPICNELLASTDDTWVMSEMPGVDEINDKICDELMNLSKQQVPK